MIEAITFDFWDTIAIDDSDEPKRAALRLPSKADSRAQLFAARIARNYPDIPYERATEAYQYANQAFSDQWRTQHRTPGVASRLYDAYDYLGLRPAPGKFAQLMREVDELVREIEDMEVRIPPDFAPGVHSTLATLHERYKLGIISDTIHTTGRGLRYLLQRQGLLQYFSYFIFSDEIGVSKPAAKVFRQAALGMHTEPSEMAHVGDRESNDIAGPLAIGMKAILFTGIKDRGSEKSMASAICHSFAELPDIIRRLPVYTPPLVQPFDRYPTYL